MAVLRQGTFTAYVNGSHGDCETWRQVLLIATPFQWTYVGCETGET